MAGGPLDDARLREVEACLNDGRFEEAQRKLVSLGAVSQLGPGVAYLTTRLLALRGRLDLEAIRERISDVLAEAPHFPEAQTYLSSLRPTAARADLAHAPTLSRALDPHSLRGQVLPPLSSQRGASETPPSSPGASSPPPFSEAPTAVRKPPLSFRQAKLETPRVPGELPGRPPPGAAMRDLGPLELPRSEVPTEPAPPPSEPTALEAVRAETEPVSLPGRGVWDPVELDLASGRVEAALSALERRAGECLDQLVARRMPELTAVAEEAADFLGGAPITCHFPAYDLSLGSLTRLDAALSLFARRPQRAPRYALSVLLAAYVGESVRRAWRGRWQGRLAEPDMATIERPRGETYQPWRAVHLAMTEGRPIRIAASVGQDSPRPASEVARTPAEPPTAWDPAPWPPFSLLPVLGRVLPGSVLGTWAARMVQVPLDRSLGSLTAIDQYLSLLATSAVPPDASGGWARRAAVLTGAYAGEVLSLNAGARWSENEDAPFGPLRFELATPDGGAAYPVLWTLERLRGQGRAIADRARSLITV